MDLCRAAPVVALISSLSGCLAPVATVFNSVGTSVDPSGTRPVAAQVSLVECDDPSLQIGPSCRVLVRVEPGGHAYYRSFSDRGGPVACVLDGRPITIKDAWGQVQWGGVLDTELSTVNDKGQLTVMSLHGPQLAKRELTPSCHPAPSEPWTASALREP